MINIFIDFDGTITTQDVGDAVFETFGGSKCSEFIEEYREGAISAIECFRRECSACMSTDKSALDTFLDSQRIDPTFKTFLDFCSNNNFQYFILSDGMDYYIERILSKNQIKNVPYYSNHLALVPLNGDKKVVFQPSFPLTDESCDRCACCKRNKMLSLSADDDIIIYIGEGYSDRCPVRYADIVFAKDELLKHCIRENISYFEYRTFADVITRLKSLAENKSTKRHFGLKKRRHAQLAARELFIGE